MNMLGRPQGPRSILHFYRNALRNLTWSMQRRLSVRAGMRLLIPAMEALSFIHDPYDYDPTAWSEMM